MNAQKLRNLTFTALLAALVLVLGITPLGLIPLGFINVTIICIPVVVGTLLLGWKAGLVLGLCFGFTSMWDALTSPSALVMPLVQRNVVVTAIMCFLPRLMVPLTAHWAHNAMAQRGRRKSLGALPAAAIAGSLTNTVLYLGLMLLFYIWVWLDPAPVLGLIGGTAIIAGSAEAITAAILVPPIVLALQKISKR
ncbi:MAG: ECF transporter S component [Oscillospiraceae bacterium]|nr:ECF transporter S component [Oscillospiraceae bacterium]